MIRFGNKTKSSLKSFYPRLREVHKRILLDNGFEPASNLLSVVFTSDKDLAKLNSTFRQMDTATDVLSFPSDEIDPDSGMRYLGDVVISMDQVGKQRDLFGDDEFSIVFLLVTHGILHLIGYDHGSASEKAEMWACQSKYLDEFQIRVHIPE